jgi:hypothetical protein
VALSAIQQSNGGHFSNIATVLAPYLKTLSHQLLDSVSALSKADNPFKSSLLADFKVRTA